MAPAQAMLMGNELVQAKQEVSDLMKAVKENLADDMHHVEEVELAVQRWSPHVNQRARDFWGPEGVDSFLKSIALATDLGVDLVGGGALHSVARPVRAFQ